ncbi:MAG: small multi-drug export protein [Candidatus Omnitrophota bacterium]|nr:small multi-drug export protein [Candidatus Omnitrophota bacterium]
MLNLIINHLRCLPQEYLVMAIGALPVSELRGAIPLGLYLGMPLYVAFFWAFLGNVIFIAPALFLLEPVSVYLRRFKIWSSFFDWVFERTKRNSLKVMRYESLGLFILVAIPLPMTGAWTGVIAATLFKIKFRYAFISIVLGVIAAGIIVSSLCALGLISWKAVRG